MTSKFPEYKQLDLSQINKDVLKEWDEKKCFQKSITTREGNPSFVLYDKETHPFIYTNTQFS